MGRPAKPKLTLQEQEDEVILKYLNGEPMTLDEAALAVWMCDGRKTKQPMTKMGFLKYERKILDKLRKEFEKAGLTKEEFFNFFNRSQSSSANGNYVNSVDEW